MFNENAKSNIAAAFVFVHYKKIKFTRKNNILNIALVLSRGTFN